MLFEGDSAFLQAHLFPIFLLPISGHYFIRLGFLHQFHWQDKAYQRHALDHILIINFNLPPFAFFVAVAVFRPGFPIVA